MIKKLLAFVALFGIGLAVLIGFDRQGGAKPNRSKGPGLGSIDTALEESEDANNVRWFLNGRLTIDQFEGGRGGRSLRLEADGSGPAEGGETRLEGVTIKMLEPQTQEIVVQVTAAEAWSHIQQSGEGLGTTTISPEIRFADVTVSLLRGSRLVPIDLTAAELSGDLKLGIFETESRAAIDGIGLRAEGEGFRLDENKGEIVFERDASCVISAEGGQPGRLACAGKMVLLQPPGEGTRPLSIVANRRALLAVESGEGLSLEANHIEIDGVIHEDRDEDGFSFERLRASSEVDLRARGHSFVAKSAEFELDPTGELRSATLMGSPQGTLDLQHSEELAGGLEIAPGGNVVKLSGEDSMEITWQPEPHFQVGGPARLEWRDAKLYARGGLSGRPAPDGLNTRIRGWTDVELELSGWKVATNDLDATLLEVGMSLDAGGHSSVTGADTEGIPLEVHAREGFSFAFDGEFWTLPAAREIQIARGGPDPMTASARELRNFDLETLAFEALGEVEVEIDQDTVRGEHLQVFGPRDLLLKGNGSDPVEFRAVAGSFEATEIRRKEDALEGYGDVRVNLAFGEVAMRLAADNLSISGEIERALDGEFAGSGEAFRGPMLIVARGTVDADIAAGVRRFDVMSQSLRLWRAPQDGEMSFRTELNAREAVTARISDPESDYQITSVELDGLFFDPFEDPSETSSEQWETQARGSIDARGDVAVESLTAPPMSGKGDSFHADETRRARLEADIDNQVSAEGFLPGTGEPFQLRAQALDFEAERLDATNPEILILGRDEVPNEDNGRIALSQLHATAGRLVATHERVRFEGRVRFTASTYEDDTWTLNAEGARFDHSGSKLSPTGAFDRLTAEKNVSISFSAGPTVVGDYLTADALTGRVRVDGTPAIFQGEFGSPAATWWAFDTKTFTPSSGPGWIEPTPPGGGKDPSGVERSLRR